MKTENLTILFSDITNYTAKTSSSSREENLKLIRMHEELLKPVIEKFGGNIVKEMGDAFLVTFKSPTNAVLAGMEMVQTALKFSEESTEGKGFTIKVAINTGEVVIENDDIYGEAVNIAARIEAMAKENQVLFSESTLLSMNRNEVKSKRLGEKDLKGIPHPVTIFKVDWDDERVEEPPTAEFEIIQSKDAPKKDDDFLDLKDVKDLCPNKENWGKVLRLYQVPSKWPLSSIILFLVGIGGFIKFIPISLLDGLLVFCLFLGWSLLMMTPYKLFHENRAVKFMIIFLWFAFFGAIKAPGINRDKPLFSGSEEGFELNAGMKVKVNKEDGLQITSPDGSSDIKLNTRSVNLKLGDQRILEIKSSKKKADDEPVKEKEATEISKEKEAPALLNSDKKVKSAETENK